MIKFEKGGKAHLKNFGHESIGDPIDGDYLVVDVTAQRVKIDIGTEVVAMKIRNARHWQWCEEGNRLMYTALA